MSDANAEARQLVRDALAQKGISQAELARRMGLSAKHVCLVLQGRAGLSLDLLAGMLEVCGKRLVLKAQRPIRK